MMRKVLQWLGWNSMLILAFIVAAALIFPMWVGFVTICVKVATAWGWLP